MLLHLVEGATLALPAILTPGPYAAFLLAETLQHGARRTFPAAFAPLVTDAFIIGLVLVVLRALPPLALASLRFAGGFLILWIAAGFVRSLRRGDAGRIEAGEASAGRSNSLMRAVGMNLLNPNPYVFWAVVAGPLLLRAWQESPASGIALLVGFYATFIGGLLGLILAFAGMGGLDTRLRATLSGVAAVGLAAFGLVQIVTAGLVLARAIP